MLRLSLVLIGGFVWLAGSAPAQLLNNASLKGAYNFRYLGVNAGGTADVALSYQGTVTFDGTTNANGYGTFTVSGQGAGALAGLQSLNIYQVLSNGMFYMTNPFDTSNSAAGGINTFLYGGVGTGAIVASSTDSVFCDMLVAVPVATSASNATLSGNYWVASMDFLGGNFTQTRNTFFSMTADGKGGLGNVTINGIAGIPGTASQSQTSNGATYTVSANGTGTMTFPAPSGVASASQLLAGARSLIVSQDGSFFVAGGASGYDMIVGVKALSGSPTGVANGLYFVSYLENLINSDGSFDVYGAEGSADEIGSLGDEIGHQRIQPDFAYAFDYSYGVPFAPVASGTVTYQQSQWAVGAGGNFIIGSGLDGNFQVTVYVKAPSLSGTGVFLNAQGIVNGATNTPFTAGVSPGEILSLYGSGMASQTATAGVLPFPTTLGGDQVNVSWVNQAGATQTAQAPMYYVSPTEISIVVPYTIPGDGSFLNFQVSNNGALSNVATVYSGPASPGIFTIPSGGIGNGAILHQDYSVVTAASPAKVGETVQIFLTGMGAVTPPVTAGAAGPVSPLSQTILPDVYIDGVPATVVYSGLAPTLGGLYQLNVTIPAGVTAGATVTIEVDTNDSFGNLTAVNVQATIPISQ